MTDPLDSTAADILALLARDSAFRVNHGLEFWNGVFARRLRRHAARPLPEMLSRLAADLQIPPVSAAFRDAIARVDALPPDDAVELHRRIQARTTLLVGLAYQRQQDEKEAKKKKATTHQLPLEN